MFDGIRALLGFRPKRSETDEKLDQALANAEALDHYFFFADQMNLDVASKRLERERGWTIVSTKLDGTEQKYLLHARQPGPVENLQELQAELDLFADEHHGEYDGWQVPGVTEGL
ncbi:MAG TPA: ribonuclease E inhibitor RraB [Candidatus Angelobacter sp.]|nr:ribonuclease E inhibitor RraB [Candidatus Angelobacter sp.]